MSAVVKAIPDVDVFLSLEPEELGAKLLFLAKARPGMFTPSSFETEIWEADMRREPAYPRNQKEAIALAFCGSLGMAGSARPDRACSRSGPRHQLPSSQPPGQAFSE